MNSKNILTLAAVVIAIVCGAGWLHEHQLLQQTRQTFVADTLDPVVQMLEENAAIVHELESAEYVGAKGRPQFFR